jgi:hypothetical protein
MTWELKPYFNASVTYVAALKAKATSKAKAKTKTPVKKKK